MEKVTVYGRVCPGRGERLPLVDFSESSRSHSPPSLEALPIHHNVPAPQQTRRRSTRLLPNLRYLPVYDENRPDEVRTAVDDGIRPPRRQSCQASTYEDLGARQGEQVQSRRNLASQNCGYGDPLGISKGSSRKHSAATPLGSTSTVLSKKIAASKAISRSYITMSTAMRSRAQKLPQKPSLATLPRPKHKKTLTGGRQIKTHLRCEHLLLGPVWGGGAPSTQQEQRLDNSLTKRKAFERHRIAKKIDALCAASARRSIGIEDQEGYDVGKRKRGREVEEEGSSPAAKHNKLIASGRQRKALVNCQHPLDHRRRQARHVTAVTGEGRDGDRKFMDRQGHLVSSDDGSSDHDECNERQRSYTKIGDMESNVRKVVLKSNIKTPRKSFRNVLEEAGSHLTPRKARQQSEANSSYGAADADSYALPRRENAYKKYDSLHSRSSRYSGSDCVYCREDAHHSLRSRCKLGLNVSCSDIAPDDVGSAPLPDHRPNAVDEPCPVCHRESTSMRDGGRRRGYYHNFCHFCGMWFGRSDQPVVFEDQVLLCGSCDRHNGSSMSDCHHCGDRPQRPERAEQCGHRGGAAADRETTAREAGLKGERPQPNLGTEEISRRDRKFKEVVLGDQRLTEGELQSSAPGAGKRPQDPKLRDRMDRRCPPFGQPYSPRHGSGGEKSTTVKFSAYSDGTNDTSITRARLECSGAFERDRRMSYEYPISNDVRDNNVRSSLVRSFRGAGILKNSKRDFGVAYSDNMYQNKDVNARSSTAPCDQLRYDYRQRCDGGEREGNLSSNARFHVDKQSRGERSMSRKENFRPSLPRGTAKVVRGRRDPTHSLVLEDHL